MNYMTIGLTRPRGRAMSELLGIDDACCTSLSTPAQSRSEERQLPGFRRGDRVVGRCRRLQSGWVWIDERSSRIFFETCKAQLCIDCAPSRAVLKGYAVRLAKPQWALMITRVGDSWPDIKDRMNRFTRTAKQHLGADRFFAAWTVEPNPSGDGHHVHAWVRGDDPSPVLSEAARSAKTGLAGVEPIWQEHGPLTYAIKGFVNLTNQSYEIARPIFDQLREINGNRQMHSTRGFWLNEAGSPCSAKDA